MAEGTTTVRQRCAKMVTYTAEEVAKHNKDTDAWLIVNGGVYDVTEFIDEHPGGMSLVVEYLGTDVSNILSSSKIHKHSAAAFSMLDVYKIGIIDKAEVQAERDAGKTTDFSKPLVHQVGMLGKDYAKWVSTDPVHFKHSVRLFGPAWMEVGTHTPWYVPLMYWIPISILFMSYALFFATPFASFATTGLVSAVLFVIGFFAWFFAEYNIHKYVYHWDRLAHIGSYLTNILHFLLHGMHHKVPMEKDRLVAPLPLSNTLAVPIIAFIHLCTLRNWYATCSISSGFLIGYLLYDTTHYILHHAANPSVLPGFMKWLVSTKYFQELRTHHLIHHFATTGHDNNFGISNKYIDIVMGSLQTEHN